MKKSQTPIATIREALKDRPLEALIIYEKELANQTESSNDLRIAYQSTMEFAICGRSIGTAEWQSDAPRLSGSPRHDDRRVLVEVTVAQLLALGRERSPLLQGLVEMFDTLVLEGPQEQQLCGRLAVALGQRSREELAPLRDLVAEPLIKALEVVLRVGAATTRDSAVEGLGALLKHFENAKKKLPHLVPPGIEEGKQAVGNPVVNRLYFDRLKRRRQMVFAVAARDMEERTEFFNRLEEPVAETIAKIRNAKLDEVESQSALLDELHSRADVLRTLPAIIRQALPGEREDLQKRAVQFLCDAASLLAIGDDREHVHSAFAHYQESVFRTIDVMIKRGATHADFDDVLTEALYAIPPTLVGRSFVCNGQVRATFALIRAASRLISDDKTESATKDAMRPIFESLKNPSPWSNLGVAEGCFYVLPFLLENDAHNDLSRPALELLFERIDDPPSFANLAETHRQLITSACFRRMILLLMQRTDERSTTDPAALRAERDVGELLYAPTVEHVIHAFQTRRFTWRSDARAPSQQRTAGVLVAGTAFDSDLLDLSVSLFQGYNTLPSVQRLLLTRILAAELRAASQDSRETARYALLRRLYAGMPTVSLGDDERLKKVRNILASLPARAAHAADADLQDFLEYCGRRDGETREELPGHVLAMVSDEPRGRMADVIAREIDLNLRQLKKQKGEFDFGKLLYQVILRGPHERIFECLLTRMEDPEDFRVVELLYEHVKKVRADPEMNGEHMLKHVDDLAKAIRDDERSITLRKLRSILLLYHELFADEPKIWEAITRGEEGGGLGELFAEFDAIAKHTHVDGSKHARQSLADAFEAHAAELRAAASDYRQLAVGNFQPRGAALMRARAVVERIWESLPAHPGLQPPERVMLIALMQRLQDFFTRTIRWYCDAPSRLRNQTKESREPEIFFTVFASPRTPLSLGLEAAKSLARDDLTAALEEQNLAERTVVELRGIASSVGIAPAEYPGQRLRFERFFVDWMVDELDVDMLKRQFEDRWTEPFRTAHRAMRSLVWVSLLIIGPCVSAVVLDLLHLYLVEGIGFFLLEATVLVVAFLSFMPRMRERISAIGRRLRGEKSRETLRRDPPPTYRFQSILPSLPRLIAAPMAVVVEFEHSYSFPLHASTAVLLVLMALTYLTTRFLVDHEMVDTTEVIGGSKKRAPESARVRQVVAVALLHAFMIAVLFATIFGSHADHVAPVQVKVQSPQQLHGIVKVIDDAARHIDEIHVDGVHAQPFFACFLPRDVVFDTAWFLQRFGVRLPRGLAAQLRFTYYPTIILTWTAFGLFFGIFIEILKGERLRSETKPDRERAA